MNCRSFEDAISGSRLDISQAWYSSFTFVLLRQLAAYRPCSTLHSAPSFTMRATTTFVGLVACSMAPSGAAIENRQAAGEYDYVIVGGGLTGFVTANRLSEDPDVSVLVLEYGKVDRSNVTQIPYYGTILNLAGLRDISSAPEPQLNNRIYGVQVSQIAGGGSQVNGMEWDLPSSAEFDACGFSIVDLLESC